MSSFHFSIFFKKNYKFILRKIFFDISFLFYHFLSFLVSSIILFNDFILMKVAIYSFVKNRIIMNFVFVY